MVGISLVLGAECGAGIPELVHFQAMLDYNPQHEYRSWLREGYGDPREPLHSCYKRDISGNIMSVFETPLFARHLALLKQLKGIQSYVREIPTPIGDKAQETPKRSLSLWVGGTCCL